MSLSAPNSGLKRVGARPAIADYVGQLWGRRHFIFADSKYRAASRNSKALLGNFWLVLRPLAEAGFYYIIFALILDVGRQVENFAAFLLVGMIMFRWSARALTQSPNIIASGKSLIRSFIFPRVSLVLSTELRDGLQMLPVVGVLLVAIVLIPPHVTPAATWALFPAIMTLQFLFNLGLAMFLARLGHILPDITQLNNIVARVAMYTSGVIFPIDQFLENPWTRALIEANPIYQLVTIYRAILIEGMIPNLQSWATIGVWSILGVVVGFLFFWQGEETYGKER